MVVFVITVDVPYCPVQCPLSLLESSRTVHQSSTVNKSDVPDSTLSKLMLSRTVHTQNQRCPGQSTVNVGVVRTVHRRNKRCPGLSTVKNSYFLDNPPSISMLTRTVYCELRWCPDHGGQPTFKRFCCNAVFLRIFPPLFFCFSFANQLLLFLMYTFIFSIIS